MSQIILDFALKLVEEINNSNADQPTKNRLYSELAKSISKHTTGSGTLLSSIQGALPNTMLS